MTISDPATKSSTARSDVAASPPFLEVAGVSKRFGGVTALDGIDLRIDAGAFFSLLGPSGCGKTTLLRIIAGLEAPDEGRVLLDGEDVTRLPPEKRPFNIVFQRYALFPHLSVHDNVAFGLTTSRRERPPKAELRERVEQALALVGLADYGARMPTELSGGQAQRVAVARAVIRRPALLLLDEPLSALDRNVRHAVREELLRIHAELGTTFLLVTHDQDEALSMSERVALMNAGRIEQLATPEEMYRNPATHFTAHFIGAGTFVEGEVLDRADGRVSVRLDAGGPVVSAADAGTGDGVRVRLLLRPEEIGLAEDAAADGLAGVTETCAFFGAHYEATVRCGAAVFRLRAPGPLAPGRPATLALPERAGIAYPCEDAPPARDPSGR